LWQSLCVPKSVKPNPKGAIKLEAEQNIADLKNQLSRLEEYFLSNQSYRLELIEHQIAQLSQQVTQLVITANQEPPTQTVKSSETALDNSTNNTVSSTPEDIDPLISRLSQFLENF
ncbi:MAG TPA: plasmid segregation centromere-binding protein ParR, partial [Richelia sp.]|nr:plasmid segregation centromere-binding protein ParR [Richelia sp.]